MLNMIIMKFMNTMNIKDNMNIMNSTAYIAMACAVSALCILYFS